MGKETPCASCPKPLSLMPENEQAWEVFLLLASQLRVAGMGVVIGIDLAPFEVVCNAKQIPMDEREDILDKVVEASRLALKYWNQPKDGDK